MKNDRTVRKNTTLLDKIKPGRVFFSFTGYFLQLGVAMCGILLYVVGSK